MLRCVPVAGCSHSDRKHGIAGEWCDGGWRRVRDVVSTISVLYKFTAHVRLQFIHVVNVAISGLTRVLAFVIPMASCIAAAALDIVQRKHAGYLARFEKDAWTRLRLAYRLVSDAEDDVDRLWSVDPRALSDQVGRA